MKRVILPLLLILGGAAVFVFGSPYYDVFPTNGSPVYNAFLATFFLVVSLIIKDNLVLSKYRPALNALGIAGLAMTVLCTGLLNINRDGMDPLQDLAVDKFSQFLHVVPVILVMSWLDSHDLKTIFIQTGNLRRGLTFGLASFIAFAVLAVLIPGASSDLASQFPQAIPWILVFIIANSLMEELWFRAIFLRKYELLIGSRAAILVTAVIFGASHVNVTYSFPGGGLVFGLVVFTLGLVGAYAMLKDDSLIGPVLFHAGYDLVIIGSVLDSL